MKQVSNVTQFFVFLFAGIAMVITSCQKEHHKKDRPFKAEFQLTSEVTQQKDATIIFTTGTGEAAPIGKLSYACHARLDATGYSDVLVLTAADGSEIHAVGKGSPPAVDPNTGDFSITYQSIITGGTGRFTGATGSFSNVSHGNLVSLLGTDSMEGTISY